MGKKKQKIQSLDPESQQRLKIIQRYFAGLDDNYRHEFDELESLYNDSSRMPARISLTEDENAVYDSHRIEFILKACSFLVRYFATGKSPLKVPMTNPEEIIVVDGIKLLNSRRLIEHIAVCIFNISGAVRAKYKHLLTPAPFTWETFEHLGGLMKNAEEWKRVVVRGIEGDLVKRFLDEYLALETTVEAAVPAIIDDDISKLKLLFSFIQKTETNQLPDSFKIKPVALTAIKAFTRRVVDLESLVQLLKLSDNHTVEFDHMDAIAQIKKRGKKDTVYCVEFEGDDARFSREITLDTKMACHAALRRIELIGELVTGKYLSSFITNLDPSIHWSALNIIRDVIAHQDEKDNRLKVQALLDDTALFQKVLGHDMQELFFKLTQVVRLRDTELPKFDNDPENFWWVVYGFEQQKLARQIAAQSAQSISAPEPRADENDIDFVIKKLTGKNAPEEIIIAWRGILSGTLDIPDKKRIGELMRHFPGRTEDKAANERCKAIANRAFNPRSTLVEREAARHKVEADAAHKKAQIEAEFSGLVNIRALAENWKQESPVTIYLNPGLRLELAINALENIREFMEQDPFIQADFNFASLAEWEKSQNQNTVMNFFARLITSPEFNDAMEYNAAQLLQHIETIREYPGAQGKRFLDKDYDYEVMRALRNWIAHGNYLNDRNDHDPGTKESLLQNRQKVVGPIMVRLIFDLLPVLKTMHAQYSSTAVSYAALSSSSPALFKPAATRIKHSKWFSDCCELAEILRRINESISAKSTDTSLFGLLPYQPDYAVGDCLFVAAAQVTLQTPEDLRKQVVTGIQSNPDLCDIIESHLTTADHHLRCGDVDVSYHSVEEYLALMGTAQTWATELEIVAMANLLQRPIAIITPGNEFDLVYGEGSPEDTMFINYIDNNHYAPLARPLNFDAAAVVALIKAQHNGARANMI